MPFVRHINYVNEFSSDEVEAAMCIWEECIHRLAEARSRGGIEAQEQDELWNWLRGGEGAACARDMCIRLCRDLEQCYLMARDWFGFDDSFDWEFVPRWCDYAMEVTEEHDLTAPWHKYIAYKVTYDWRETFG